VVSEESTGTGDEPTASSGRVSKRTTKTVGKTKVFSITNSRKVILNDKTQTNFEKIKMKIKRQRRWVKIRRAGVFRRVPHRRGCWWNLRAPESVTSTNLSRLRRQRYPANIRGKGAGASLSKGFPR